MNADPCTSRVSIRRSSYDPVLLKWPYALKRMVTPWELKTCRDTTGKNYTKVQLTLKNGKWWESLTTVGMMEHLLGGISVRRSGLWLMLIWGGLLSCMLLEILAEDMSPGEAQWEPKLPFPVRKHNPVLPEAHSDHDDGLELVVEEKSADGLTYTGDNSVWKLGTHQPCRETEKYFTLLHKERPVLLSRSDIHEKHLLSLCKYKIPT